MSIALKSIQTSDDHRPPPEFKLPKGPGSHLMFFSLLLGDHTVAIPFLTPSRVQFYKSGVFVQLLEMFLAES